jgi:hypothetical protein
MSTAVTTGAALGGSLALAQIFELPDGNPVVQAMYKNKHRAAITSTVISLGVAAFCGPVPGLISECINYPAALYKVRKVRKHKEKTNPQPYEIPTRTESVGDLLELNVNQLKGIIL